MGTALRVIDPAYKRAMIGDTGSPVWTDELPPPQPKNCDPAPAGRPALGKFIVFEGIDGSGKSSALDRLFQRMKASNSPARPVKTKHPGASRFGDALRHLMFHDFKSGYDIEPTALELLFAADHCHNRANIVEPALRAGLWVLSDRDLPVCGPVYRPERAIGADRELPPQFYEAINGRSHDLLFLFDGDPEKLLFRARKRRSEDHQEAKAWNTPEAATRMRDRYLKRYGSSINTVIIDAEQWPADADAQIDHALWKRFGLEL